MEMDAAGTSAAEESTRQGLQCGRVLTSGRKNEQNQRHLQQCKSL